MLSIFFCRHPDVFDGVIAFSGLYSLENPDFGLSRDNMDSVYYNSPLSYLSSLNDNWFLDHIRRSKIVLVCGQGRWEDECLPETKHLGDAFRRLGCEDVWVEIWGHDVDHDWVWWRKQFPFILGRIL